jgi:predicted phosphoribosyltransferase
MVMRSDSPRRFRDRQAAGVALGQALAAWRDRDLLVLGLPRGGVVVACEVARSLGATLDVLLVRKLGVPGHEELAFGAIASGVGRVINDDIVRGLRIPPATMERVTQLELAELHRRERAYRGDRSFPAVQDRPVVLVDDGAATGATMRAAVAALRSLAPGRLIVGLPVSSREAFALLESEADEVCCLLVPEHFAAVGQWYESFAQTTDAEVCALLEARAT